MEMDLKNIIEKIKKEGVAEGEKKADDIIKQAELKAKEAINSAEEKKKEIIASAGKEAQRLEKNAKVAVSQASRDVLLSLKEEIIALFDKAMKKEVKEKLSGDTLKDMIVHLAENFKKTDKDNIEILLSEEDKKALEGAVLAAFKKEMAKGVTIKTSPHIEKGFRIGIEGKNSYYDFTDDAIVEAFKSFLNPKVSEMLNTGKENV